MIKQIGAVTAFTAEPWGLKFETEAFHGFIRFYAENIAQTCIANKSEHLREHSYARVIQEQLQPVVESTDNHIVLRTNGLTVRIQKSPFRLTMLDAQHNCLMQDDGGMGICQIGSAFHHYRALQQDESFYAMGEKTGPINRRAQAFCNWNTDKFGYADDEDPLYLSIPFFIGRHDAGTYGYFLDNSYKSTFNFGASSDRFAWTSVEGGPLNYYTIAGPTELEIIQAYTRLTGAMPLPPLWSLGYQQCRYSYYPDTEVRELAQGFRDKDVPADVIYLDIHYMQDYKAFTFDKSRFPNPKQLLSELQDLGFKVITIVDPGIKAETGYDTYDRGLASDVYCRLVDGSLYQGEVWPGWSCFPDFTNEKTRDWWQDELAYYTELDVAGVWNDMNEPAAWGQSLPHALMFDMDGQPSTMDEGRNVYGMQMARASYEGMLRNKPDLRPFVLTRAGFSGIQRYSAVWTGDNVSSSAHLMLSIRMLLSLAMSGISFAGSDIGGFAGDADRKLHVRWVALAVFQPLFRAHSQVNTKSAEPWSFGEEALMMLRNMIKLRYRLLPYIYSTFYTHTQQLIPVMRALFLMYPEDEVLRQDAYQHQYMFGDALLVLPATHETTIYKAYFPEGAWYKLTNDAHLKGGKERYVEAELCDVPVYVKAGAIIPMQSERSNTAAQQDDCLILHVYKGPDNEFMFYEDDGVSFDYEKGAFGVRKILLNGNNLNVEELQGAYHSSYAMIKVYFHGWYGLNSVHANGNKLELNYEDTYILQPIPASDAFTPAKGQHMQLKNLPFVHTELTAKQLNFTLDSN